MRTREELYFTGLVVAAAWALTSALAVAVSIEMEARRYAWGWAASFALSALGAAYCFGRLLGGAS